MFRIFCGSLTLGLSLVCVIASFNGATRMAGSDALTLWGFFAWGAALALGGAWLIRGRSKGKAIVLVWERRRILFAAFLAAIVVGLLFFVLSQPSMTEDPIWWPLMLQTMFAVLFASLPLTLFDREDHKERDAPVRLNAAGRRQVKRRLVLVSIVGAVSLTAAFVVDPLMDSWWRDLLINVGVALLGVGVVFGYRLRKKTDPGASGQDSNAPH